MAKTKAATLFFTHSTRPVGPFAKAKAPN